MRALLTLALTTGLVAGCGLPAPNQSQTGSKQIQVTSPQAGNFSTKFWYGGLGFRPWGGILPFGIGYGAFGGGVFPFGGLGVTPYARFWGAVPLYPTYGLWGGGLYGLGALGLGFPGYRGLWL